MISSLGCSEASDSCRRWSPNPAGMPRCHLMGSIFHKIFDMGELRVARGIPTEILRQKPNMEPIAGLI